VVEPDERSHGDWIPIEEGLFDYPLRDGDKACLNGNRCGRCGSVFFPRRELCPSCFQEGLDTVKVTGPGIIYACTVIHRNSPSGIVAPYAYGYIDLPKFRLRVFGLLTGGPPSSFRSGQEVDLVLEPLRTEGNGRRVMGYKFKALT